MNRIGAASVLAAYVVSATSVASSESPIYSPAARYIQLVTCGTPDELRPLVLEDRPGETLTELPSGIQVPALDGCTVRIWRSEAGALFFFVAGGIDGSIARWIGPLPADAIYQSMPEDNAV
jgi:hypothetical protein